MEIYNAGGAYTCGSSLHVNTIQQLLDYMEYLLKKELVRHEWIALRIALATKLCIPRVPTCVCLYGPTVNSGSSVRLEHFPGSVAGL